MLKQVQRLWLTLKAALQGSSDFFLIGINALNVCILMSAFVLEKWFWAWSWKMVQESPTWFNLRHFSVIHLKKKWMWFFEDDRHQSSDNRLKKNNTKISAYLSSFASLEICPPHEHLTVLTGPCDTKTQAVYHHSNLFLASHLRSLQVVSISAIFFNKDNMQNNISKGSISSHEDHSE